MQVSRRPFPLSPLSLLPHSDHREPIRRAAEFDPT